MDDSGTGREGTAREGTAREGTAPEGTAREGAGRAGTARDEGPGAAPYLIAPPPPPPADTPRRPTGRLHGGDDEEGGGPRRPPFAAAAGLGRAAVREIGAHSPWVLASASVLFVFVLGWLASILTAFRHSHGMTGRDRLLALFAPGSVEWALAIVLAVGLLGAGRRLGEGSRGVLPLDEMLPSGLLLAAGAVGASAVIDLLAELTNFGNGIDAALAGFISYSAVLPLSAVSAWWAYRLHTERPPASPR